jgi:hypothetical protein
MITEKITLGNFHVSYRIIIQLIAQCHRQGTLFVRLIPHTFLCKGFILINVVMGITENVHILCAN